MQQNYLKLFDALQDIDQVIICSLLPVEMIEQTQIINENVILLNHFLKQEADKRNFLFLDLYNLMVSRDGGIKVALTSDGVHLTPKAYTLWETALTPYL